MNEGGALTPDRQVMTCLLPAQVSAGKRHVFFVLLFKERKGYGQGVRGSVQYIEESFKSVGDLLVQKP